MKWIHRHQWVETERIVAYGMKKGGPFECSMEHVERLMFGITSIVLTCSECGWKRVVESKGVERSA
jgi:hypothetical protein